MQPGPHRASRPPRTPQRPSGPLRDPHGPPGPLRAPQGPPGPPRAPRAPHGPVQSLRAPQGPSRPLRAPQSPSEPPRPLTAPPCLGPGRCRLTRGGGVARHAVGVACTKWAWPHSGWAWPRAGGPVRPAEGRSHRAPSPHPGRGLAGPGGLARSFPPLVFRCHPARRGPAGSFQKCPASPRPLPPSPAPLRAAPPPPRI